MDKNAKKLKMLLGIGMGDQMPANKSKGKDMSNIMNQSTSKPANKKTSKKVKKKGAVKC